MDKTTTSDTTVCLAVYLLNAEACVIMMAIACTTSAAAPKEISDTPVGMARTSSPIPHASDIYRFGPEQVFYIAGRTLASTHSILAGGVTA